MLDELRVRGKFARVDTARLGEALPVAVPVPLPEFCREMLAALDAEEFVSCARNSNG